MVTDNIVKQDGLNMCQNACFKDIIFICFSAVPNRFKYHQNACFRDIVFIIFSAVQIVSNTISVYALETCFSKCFNDVI